MLSASASLLNIPVTILDNGAKAPAKQIVASEAHIDGSFADPAKIHELAKKVDILTMEIEHVDVEALERLSKDPELSKLEIHPSPETIRIIQDKYQQKVHLNANGLPIGEYVAVEGTPESVQEAVTKLGLPLMLKSRTLAYDGRGNYALRKVEDIPEAMTQLGGRPLYAEKWVPFVKEVAVMVVRTTSGEVASYPVVETVHKNNICHLVFAPLRSRDPTLSHRARTVAENAVKTFTGAGVFGVEMFLLENGMLRPFITSSKPRTH